MTGTQPTTRAENGHAADVTVYAIWTSADLDDDDPARDLVGPWSEVVVAADGLVFVESDHTLSQVYHAMKWSLPDGVALFVAAISTLPKAKGLAPGTNSWLRARLS